MDWIVIRFHFGGAFVNADGLLLYVDGQTAESRIELDKLSFFEIKGHLADHFSSPSTMRMYWLKPGMELGNGLILLVDDASCHIMAGYHRDGSIVDMYVEEVAMELTAYGEDIWAGVDEVGDDEPEASHHAIYDTDDAGIMERRRREEGEQPKGTKLTRVGIKMTCRLCKKSDHNARRCPKNPEAGNKVNAHIKRAKSRKRKDVESASTSAVANDQAGNRNTRAKRTATTERTAVGTSGHQATHSAPTHSQASHSQAPRVATQPIQSTTTRHARQRSTQPNQLAHLMFGDNY